MPPRLWISCHGCTFYDEVAQPPKESQCNMSLYHWKICKSITPHATCHVSLRHLQIYRNNRLGRFLVTLGRVTWDSYVSWWFASQHIIYVWSVYGISLCNNKVECWVNPCHPTHLLTNHRTLCFCSTWWSIGGYFNFTYELVRSTLFILNPHIWSCNH